MIPFSFWKDNIHFGRSWTWMSGSSSYNLNGVYGTMGTASLSNNPGGRNAGIGWLDSSGNVWIFGGSGYDSVGTSGSLNDLWEYTPGTGMWMWVSGSSTAWGAATYGTKGTPSTSNIPSARFGMSSWTDTSGNFWLFGGLAINQYVNDLWEYNPGTNQWTWVAGTNSINKNGVYGTKGTPSTSNYPGGRMGSTSWIDNSGNFWIFGGQGYAISGSSAVNLNDLWEYIPGTGTWTWVSGSSAGGSISATCGTKGTGLTTNTPGATSGAIGWADSLGNLWLFIGGFSVPGGGGGDWMNVLWKFTPSTSKWTWVSGACASSGAAGVYGNQGMPAASNVPGSRSSAASWSDASGNLWFFGGIYPTPNYEFNDIWMYNTTSGIWTWMQGANATVQTAGNWGSKGIPGPYNYLNSRDGAIGLSSGNTIWIFGGEDNSNNQYNDLWRAQ